MSSLLTSPTTWSREAAYRYCKSLARTHYENFTVGSLLLPAEMRPFCYTIYAYCRSVDDLGDEASGDRLNLLDLWEQELRKCYSSTPHHPVMVALQETIQRFDIPMEPFLKLIEANRMDQRISRYPTYADLLHYCEHSANPVGHLVLYLFGYRDDERQRLANYTCTALQLTNFWQDVRRDLEQLGRIYIPVEDMARFGYTEDELAQRVFNDNFRRLMAFEVERARDLFKQGLKLVDLVHGRFKLDMAVFTQGGMHILKAIQSQDYNVLKHRPTLSKWGKARLLLSTGAQLALGRKIRL